MSRQKSRLLFILGSTMFMAQAMVHAFPWAQSFGPFYLVAVPGVLVYLTHNHTAWFSLYHGLFSFLCQVAASYSASVYASNIREDANSLLFILLAYSPLMVLCMIPIICASTFRTQFVVQIFCNILSYFWVYPFCQHAKVSFELAGHLEEMRWQLKSLGASLFLVIVEPHCSQYECMVWPGFLHLTVGLLIPIGMKYVLESYNRAKYLDEICEPEARTIVWGCFSNSVKVACVVGVLLCLLYWPLVEKLHA